jgi:type VI secretion system protein ImpH
MSPAAPQPLIDRLLKEAPRFSFFQTIRLIEQAVPQAVRIGHQGPPGREAVRIRPALSLGFASADVAEVRRLPDSGEVPRYEVTATFLGIYGASSPLPTYFTEWLLDLEEGSVVRGFIDLFHHRIYSLFHRILGKYRCAMPHPGEHGDSFQWRLQTLLGVSDREDRSAGGVRGAFLLGYAGLIAQQPRSADTLRRVLADYFAGIEVGIEQCVPRWTPLPEDQLNRLAGANSRLGMDALAGERVFNRVTTFRLTLGPMRWKDQESFLPGGLRHHELRQLVGLFNDNGLDYEVELSVPAADLPCLPLGDAHARLGYTTRAEGVDQPFYRTRFLVGG